MKRTGLEMKSWSSLLGLAVAVALSACNAKDASERSLLSEDESETAKELEAERERLQELQAYTWSRTPAGPSGQTELTVVVTEDGVLDEGSISELGSALCGAGTTAGGPWRRILHPTSPSLECLTSVTEPAECMVRHLLELADERNHDIVIDTEFVHAEFPPLSAAERPAFYRTAFQAAAFDLGQLYSAVDRCGVFPPELFPATAPGCEDCDTNEFLPRHFFAMVSLVREAAEKYVQATIQVADSQYGTSLSPAVDRDRAYKGQHLSRMTAAAFLLGVDPAVMADPNNLPNLTLGPRLSAEGVNALRVLRLAAPPLSLFDGGTPGEAADRVLGVDRDPDSVAVRIETDLGLPSPIDSPYRTFRTSREATNSAMQWIADIAAVYDTPVSAFREEDNGLRRYAVTGADSQLREPGFWVRKFLSATGRQSLFHEVFLFEDSDPPNPPPPGLLQVETLIAEMFELLETNAIPGMPPALEVEMANLAATQLRSRPVELTRLGMPNANFAQTFFDEDTAPDYLLLDDPTTEQLLCATQHHIDGYPCPEAFHWENVVDTNEAFLVQAVSDRFLRAAGNSELGPDGQPGTADDLFAPAHYLLRNDSPCRTACAPEDGNYWTLVAVLPNYPFVRFLPELQQRAGEILTPDPERRSRPLTQCATGNDEVGVFDQRLPLGSQLTESNNVTAVENSWLHFLTRAEEAAELADQRGREYLQSAESASRDQVDLDYRERAREASSRGALEGVYEICGDEEDIRAEINRALEEGEEPSLSCLDPSSGVTVALGDSPLCFCSDLDCPRPTALAGDCTEGEYVDEDHTLGFFHTTTFDPPRDPCTNLREVRASGDVSQLDVNLLTHGLQADVVQNRISNLRYEAMPTGYSRVESNGVILASTDPGDSAWPCVESSIVDCSDLSGPHRGSAFCPVPSDIDCSGNPFSAVSRIPHYNSELFRWVMDAANLVQGNPVVIAPFRAWGRPAPSVGELFVTASGRILLRESNEEETYYWTDDGQGPEPLFAWESAGGALYLYDTEDSSEDPTQASSGFARWHFNQVVENGIRGQMRSQADAQTISLDLHEGSTFVTLLGSASHSRDNGVGWYAGDWFADNNGARDEWPIGAPHPPSASNLQGGGVQGHTLDPTSFCYPSDNCPDDENQSIWNAKLRDVDDQLDALELACIASASGEVCGEEPPIVRTPRDFPRLATYFQCQGRVLENRAARLAFEQVPIELLGNGRNEQGVISSDRGALAEEYSRARQQLQQFALHNLEIGRVVRQVGVAIGDIDAFVKIADIEAEIADLRVEASTATNINTCVQAVAQAVQAGTSASTPWAAVGAAAAGAASVASCATANTLIQIDNEIADLEGEERGLEISARVGEFNARMGDLSDELTYLSTTIAQSAEGFKAALGRAESLRAKALRQFQEAAWHLAPASEEEERLSTYLSNRSISALQEYQRSLRDAKNATFLAKRAVEQRLGVRLEEMTTDLPLVEAPARWESKLCALSAIDYHSLQEAPEEQADALLGQLFIGDYVRRLENVVESYRLKFPFREGRDSVVVSIRDEIQGVRKECEQAAPNLLAGTVDVDSATALLSPASPWVFVCDGPNPSDCFEFVAASETLGVPAELPGIRAHELSSPGGDLSQVLRLDPGTYRLSWYAPASSAVDAIFQVDETPQDTIPTWIDVPAFEASDVEVVVEPDGSPEWRRAWATFEVDAVTRVRTGLTVQSGSQVFAAPMLERVSDLVQFILAQPRPFFDTGESSTAFLATCPDTGGVAFRATQWQRGCEFLCPTGFSGSCDSTDATQFCYYETSFAIPQRRLDRGELFSTAGLSRGNFNYRIEALGLNVVGTGLRTCETAESPESCYAAGFLPFSLYQEGPFEIIDYEGRTAPLSLFDGRVEQGRALATERYLTNPLSSNDASLIEQMMRSELAGMPLDGRFRLRLWDAPGFDFTQVEDVQLVLDYLYWTRSLDL